MHSDAVAVRGLVDAAGLDATNTLVHEPAGPDNPLGAMTAQEVPFRVDPERTSSLIGGALRELHHVEVPGSHALQVLSMADVVAEARLVLEVGSGAPIDDAYAHIERPRLVEILAQGALDLGESTDAALSHGSPTLDRLVCVAGRPVGFVDWAELALADVHRDLASAAIDVASTLGPMAIAAMFDAYGSQPNPQRLDWWVLAHTLTRRARTAEPGGSNELDA